MPSATTSSASRRTVSLAIPNPTALGTIGSGLFFKWSIPTGIKSLPSATELWSWTNAISTLGTTGDSSWKRETSPWKVNWSIRRNWSRKTSPIIPRGIIGRRCCRESTRVEFRKHKSRKKWSWCPTPSSPIPTTKAPGCTASFWWSKSRMADTRNWWESWWRSWRNCVGWNRITSGCCWRMSNYLYCKRRLCCDSDGETKEFVAAAMEKLCRKDPLRAGYYQSLV